MYVQPKYTTLFRNYDNIGFCLFINQVIIEIQQTTNTEQFIQIVFSFCLSKYIVYSFKVN